MKILIFLNRIALICNICFILVEIMRYSGELELNDVYSTIIVLGYVSFVLNLLLALYLLVATLAGKPVLKSLPRWLIITNFLFLIAQIFIFFT